MWFGSTPLEDEIGPVKAGRAEALLHSCGPLEDGSLLSCFPSVVAEFGCRCSSVRIFSDSTLTDELFGLEIQRLAAPDPVRNLHGICTCFKEKARLQRIQPYTFCHGGAGEPRSFYTMLAANLLMQRASRHDWRETATQSGQCCSTVVVVADKRPQTPRLSQCPNTHSVLAIWAPKLGKMGMR